MRFFIWGLTSISKQGWRLVYPGKFVLSWQAEGKYFGFLLCIELWQGMYHSNFLTYIDIGKETFQTKTCTICFQNEE